MDHLPLQAFPASVNLGIFVAAAAVVWFAATRLAGLATVIADKTNAGEAFIGTLLIGVVASLPETAMALTAAATGNPELAVSTLLGGIVFSVLILAVTDAVIGKEPLTSDIQHPVAPLQGTLVVLLLVVTAAGISVGDVPVLGVGAWTGALCVLYVLSVVVVKRTQGRDAWVVRASSRLRDPHAGEDHALDRDPRSMRRVVLLTVAASAVVLIAGFVSAMSADVLATQTGLGASFVGMIFGGLATSLPEASSTISAARLGQYEMVFADAFGTNVFSLMLLFLCDVVFLGGPILNEVGRFSLFATLAAAAVTAVYVAGLIARPKTVFLRMGVDSVLVLLMGSGALVLLYCLRG